MGPELGNLCVPPITEPDRFRSSELPDPFRARSDTTPLRQSFRTGDRFGMSPQNWCRVQPNRVSVGDEPRPDFGRHSEECCHLIVRTRCPTHLRRLRRKPHRPRTAYLWAATRRRSQSPTTRVRHERGDPMASQPPAVVSGELSFIHTGRYSQRVQIECDMRRATFPPKGGRGPGPTRVLGRSSGRKRGR